MWIPILGWIIAGILELKRRQPKRKHIEQQLAARTQSTSAAWGTDPECLRIVRIVSEELQREFGWPSQNFLPADRLDLLFWRDHWDAEILVFAIEAGKRLGVDLFREKQWDHKGTLGQFVERVQALIEK